MKLIGRYNTTDCLIYADPPYMPETRNGGIYAHECDAEFHEKLLDALVKHKGSVVISGYDNDLYNNRLKDWRRVERDARAELGELRREVLWVKEAEMQNG